MKYYLVNYIILQNKRVTENEYVGVTLHTFANIDGFKKAIAEIKNGAINIDDVVIKSYKQISEDSYNSLPTTGIHLPA